MDQFLQEPAGVAGEVRVVDAVPNHIDLPVRSDPDDRRRPGGDGLISVASNEAPGMMSQLNDLALAGQWDEARALHYRLLPLMDGNFIESSPGPVKAALALMGLLEENLRLPLVPVQEKTRNRMREILIEVGLLKETSHAVA